VLRRMEALSKQDSLPKGIGDYRHLGVGIILCSAVQTGLTAERHWQPVDALGHDIGVDYSSHRHLPVPLHKSQVLDRAWPLPEQSGQITTCPDWV
jgi:hypothetical protein